MSWIRLLCGGKNCHVTWSKERCKNWAETDVLQIFAVKYGPFSCWCYWYEIQYYPRKGSKATNRRMMRYIALQQVPFVARHMACIAQEGQRNCTPAFLHLSSLRRDASIGSMHVTTQHRLAHSTIFCMAPRQAKIETEKQNPNTATGKTMLNSRIPATT